MDFFSTERQSLFENVLVRGIKTEVAQPICDNTRKYSICLKLVSSRVFVFRVKIHRAMDDALALMIYNAVISRVSFCQHCKLPALNTCSKTTTFTKLRLMFRLTSTALLSGKLAFPGRLQQM